MYRVFYWRKRWDSNPRALAGYLISSQGRYDHFDTLPYMFTPENEGNNRYSIFQKTRTIVRTGIVYHIFLRIARPFSKKVPQSEDFSVFSLCGLSPQTAPCSSSARILPMNTPIADAIISPLVHPLESPRQCSPLTFVFSRSSIFTRLL